MEIAISNNDLEFRTGILELIFEAQRFGTYDWDGNCDCSNGVIFDTEEIQCMIDVLLKEFENQIDFNNIMNEQPELCQALSFCLIQWLTIPISNENANLELPSPKFLKSSYWKNQKLNIFFGSALLIFTGLFCTLIGY